MKEGKQGKSWTPHSTGVLGMNYGNDGRIVTCGRDNSVVVWDGSGNKIRSLDGAEDLPLRAVFTSDGEHIMATDFSGHVIAWLIKDGKKSGELDANPTEAPRQMAASASTTTPATVVGGK
jgi:WD40 repeat protein